MGPASTPERPVQQIEIARQRVPHRIKTPRTRSLKISGPLRPHPDVGNDFLGSAMLAQQFSLPLDGQVADLLRFFSVVDRPSREGQVKTYRLAFEIEQGDQHRMFLLPPHRAPGGHPRADAWGSSKGIGDNLEMQ